MQHFTVADQGDVRDPFDLTELRPTREEAAPPHYAKTIYITLNPGAATASFTRGLIVLSTKKARL